MEGGTRGAIMRTMDRPKPRSNGQIGSVLRGSGGEQVAVGRWEQLTVAGDGGRGRGGEGEADGGGELRRGEVGRDLGAALVARPAGAVQKQHEAGRPRGRRRRHPVPPDWSSVPASESIGIGGWECRRRLLPVLLARSRDQKSESSDDQSG